MENELNRPFPEETQMAKNCTKKYSTFLTIRGMQVKTTWRFISAQSDW
jgi:hypothetical protein